jgi:tetratricopeptide (TPR) repeat protein
MSSHLIITVHGIRTFGQWQERLESIVLESAPAGEIEFINYKFGYFSIIGFIVPFFRWLVVREFRTTLVRLCTEVPRSRIDLVGHSFGTHVIGWAIAGLPSDSPIRIRTVILSGSVLKAGFPWRDLLGHRVDRVANDCGTKDGVLLLSQFVVLFTGMAGRTGFAGATSKLFRNRYSVFGHSGYFLDTKGKPSDAYMRARWLPLLRGENEITEFDCRTASSIEGLVTFLADNAEPIKILVYVAPFALISWWIYGLYVEANQQRMRAEQALERATRSSDDLVFEIAQRFEDQKGIPQELIVAILKKAEALVDVSEKYGALNPTTERTLGVALVELSARALQQRNVQEAVRSATRAKEIFERLGASSHSNAFFSDLAVAYDRLGDALQQRGDRDGALNSYQKFLGVAQKLVLIPVGADINNAQELLAVAYEKMGTLSSDGDPANALNFYLECFHLRSQLAQTDPTLSKQRDLAIILSHLADAQSATGQSAAAIRSYNDSLVVLNKLIGIAPANTQFMRDTAVTNERMGDMLRSAGDLPGALSHYDADLRIMNQLLESDQTNQGWRLDILKSYFRVADSLVEEGRLSDALHEYEKGLELALKFGGDIDAADWRSISAFYQRLCDVTSRQGDLAGARKLATDGSNFFERFMPSQRGRFAQSLNREAWYAIIANDFKAALILSDRATRVQPEEIELRLNKIHSLVFSEQVADARSVYFETVTLFHRDPREVAELLKRDLHDLDTRGFSTVLIDQETKLLEEWTA